MHERYDLFIPDSAFDTPMVQRLPGCFTARSFAYQLRVTVLGARDDVCVGISRANEGIVYTGCGTNPGTPKIWLCQKLDKPFFWCGSLMAVFGPGGGALEWFRLCGNCNFVHEMVDRVVREAALWDAELGEESAREGYISA